MLVDSPPELALQPGDFPVVTFLVFNQYLGWKEDLIGSSCFPSDSLPDPYPLANRNTAFFLESATLIFRQTLALPRSPPQARPRLWGNNSEWLGRSAAFTNLPCVSAAKQSAGYFGAPGVWDAKGFFEGAAFGYTSCAGGVGSAAPFHDISQVNYLKS